MVMTEKVLILAGGEGKRLRPLTSNRPKPDVYMGGSKRILEYVIDCFARADYYDITLAVEYMADNIRDYFGDGSEFIYGQGLERHPLRITYSQGPRGDSFDGTADALRKSRLRLAKGVGSKNIRTQESVRLTPDEYISHPENYHLQAYDDAETIAVGSGDLLTNFSIAELIAAHKNTAPVATLAVYPMEPENIAGKFGVAKIDKTNRIIGFKEKPPLHEIDSNLINAGIYVFDREVFGLLEKERGLKDIGGHLLPRLLELYPGQLMVHCMGGYWNDIGTIEGYRETNLSLIDGLDDINIYSHKQREQENSRILGNARHSLVGQGCEIGQGADIEDCVIGNDVYIGPNVKLRRCILFPRVSVHGIKGEGEDWILDRNVEIYPSEIGRGVVIGRGTTVKEGSRIHPNVKIDRGFNISGEVTGDMTK